MDLLDEYQGAAELVVQLVNIFVVVALLAGAGFAVWHYFGRRAQSDQAADTAKKDPDA